MDCFKGDVCDRGCLGVKHGGKLCVLENLLKFVMKQIPVSVQHIEFWGTWWRKGEDGPDVYHHAEVIAGECWVKGL